MTKSSIIKSRKVYSGRIIELSVDTLVLPNGNTVELEIISHPGGAAVVALNDRDQVCLIRQYRHIARDWLWELPAGKIDQKEDPGVTAKRELQEEAGVSAAQWHSLGYYTSSPGVFGERVYLYLARDLINGPTDHEDDEVIEVKWIAFEQARRWALDNTITDGKSALALLRAWDYVKQDGA